MASVNSSVEITLTKEEKELLERAIAKIKDIYDIDETDIYSILLSLTRQYDGKPLTVIEIDE